MTTPKQKNMNKSRKDKKVKGVTYLGSVHIHSPKCLKTLRLDGFFRKRWIDYCRIDLEVISSRPHGNTDPIKALKEFANL